MKKIASARLCAVLLCALLGACAATGTRVTSDGGAYKSMANSQQWWCSSVGGGCDCTIDGMKATCSLAQACLSSGNCKAAP
jgi:hypothetical protein